MARTVLLKWWTDLCPLMCVIHVFYEYLEKYNTKYGSFREQVNIKFGFKDTYASSTKGKNLCLVHWSILALAQYQTHRWYSINTCWMKYKWWLFCCLYFCGTPYHFHYLLFTSDTAFKPDKASLFAVCYPVFSWSFTVPFSNFNTSVKWKFSTHVYFVSYIQWIAEPSISTL